MRSLRHLWKGLKGEASNERIGCQSAVAFDIPYEPLDPAGAQGLLDDLTRRPAPPGTVQIILHKGLLPTADNVATVMNLLSSLVNTSTKVSLIRLLASLHTADNRSGRNADIRCALQARLHSRNEQVASAVVHAYVVLRPTPPDLFQVIDYALTRRLLDTDTCSMHLGINLLGFSSKEQAEAAAFLARLDKPKGALAVSILLSRSTARTSKLALSSEMTQLLYAFIARHEPRVPAVMNAMKREAMAYCGWLDAISLLHEAIGEASYAGTVLASLGREETDTYVILAFLGSEMGKRLIQRSDNSAELQHLARRALRLARGVPAYEFMAKEVRRNLPPLSRLTLAWHTAFRSQNG